MTGYNDIGKCPNCGAQRWDYTELEQWNGRKCGRCNGIFIHDDAGLKQDTDR